MTRAAAILSVLGFLTFNYAQYQGWSLFARDSADTPYARTGGAARIYHK